MPILYYVCLLRERRGPHAYPVLLRCGAPRLLARPIRPEDRGCSFPVRPASCNRASCGIIAWNNRGPVALVECARLWLGPMCVITLCGCGSLHCRLRVCAVVRGRTETALGLAGCHGTIDRLLGFPNRLARP